MLTGSKCMVLEQKDVQPRMSYSGHIYLKATPVCFVPASYKLFPETRAGQTLREVIEVQKLDQCPPNFAYVPTKPVL